MILTLSNWLPEQGGIDMVGPAMPVFCPAPPLLAFANEEWFDFDLSDFLTTFFIDYLGELG
jgi:hypothetical protein